MSVSAVAVLGQYAYVVAVESGLFVVDISDPTSPKTIAEHAVPGLTTSVALIGDRVYVGYYDPMQFGYLDWFPWYDRWGGVAIIDVRDPTKPVTVGALPVGAPGALLADGRTLWMASEESGLWAWPRQ